MVASSRLAKEQPFSNTLDIGKPLTVKASVKLCIMLSHASKGHNLILMISYICRVILNCTMTSLTLCCLVMTLSMSFVLF